MSAWAIPILLATAQGVTEAYGVITSDLIRAHVEYLASDALLGRGPGEPGGELAARYVAAQFRRLRLEPAGMGGGYLQAVPLDVLAGDDGSTLSYRGPEGTLTVSIGEGFTPDGPCARAEILEGPLAYVGYGLSAPEAKYDDLAGVDLTGRIVLALWGAPKEVLEKGAGWRAHPALKAAAVRARGARGLVLVVRDQTTFDLLSRVPWATPAPGFPAGFGAPDALVSDSVAGAILSAADVDPAALFELAEEGDATPRVLAGTLSIVKRPRFRRATAWNVLAILPGTDPATQNEAVVLTAGYDGLGVARGEAGDSIHNGAVAAAAIAKLLGLAEALSAFPGRRTIVLAATAGAPFDRLGGWSYVANPTWSTDATVAAVSLDGGLELLGLPREVALHGGTLSDLAGSAGRAARIVALRPAPEPNPEDAWLLGAGHYPFLAAGIPAVAARSGTVFQGRDERWGAQARARYHAERALTPADEVQPEFDYRGPAALAQWAYVFARILADGEATPQWSDRISYPRPAADAPPACLSSP